MRGTTLRHPQFHPSTRVYALRRKILGRGSEENTRPEKKILVRDGPRVLVSRWPLARTSRQTVRNFTARRSRTHPAITAQRVVRRGREQHIHSSKREV